MAVKSPIVLFEPSAKRRNSELLGAATITGTADLSDPESQRVLTAAARAVARELGRQAARDYFAELIKRAVLP
jgi:hypothetical protein